MKPEMIPLILGFATFLGTLSVVVIGFLFSNSRITDVKELFRAEIKAVEASLLSQIKAVEGSLLSQMATYQMDIISKIAELDNRISRLER